MQRFRRAAPAGGDLLSGITSALNSTRKDMQVISAQVVDVAAKNDALSGQLAALMKQFEEFVARDRAHKEISVSETRLVRVNQELETKYGHHAELRRRATGILQATDLNIVREETIRTATEEMMIGAPGYWLAPALVALSAWIADKRELAERALAESLRRDGAKTALLLSLVCRRLGRLEASRRWLAHYFSLQDSSALDREAVLLIDGLANGVFGATGRAESLPIFDSWLDQNRSKVGIIEAQRDRWKAALHEWIPAETAGEFPYLRKYSPQWPALLSWLQGSRLHHVCLTNIKRVFEGEVVLAPQLVRRVDALIERLVSEFDREELPLRREERRLNAIVRHSGDRSAAEAEFAIEEGALHATQSFAQLLTSAALGISRIEISRATQRLAFALSAPWIAQAHDDVTAETRAKEPAEITIAMDDWSGSTKDGANEAELVASLSAGVARKTQLATLGITGLRLWWPAIAAVPAFALMLKNVNFLFLGIGLVALQAVLYFLYRSKRQTIELEATKQREGAGAIVKACCAEIVDLLEIVKREDARAAELRTAVSALRSDAYFAPAPDESRRVVMV